MRKIAFANAKGGVGKTSTVVNVGAALAQDGQSVLLVDLDTQGQVSRCLGVQPPIGLAELLQEEATPEEVQTEARERLSVIAGGRKLAGIKRMISQRQMRPELVLSEALNDLSGYDYVLLDTAPSWDVLNINCLFYADEVVVPVSMEALALEGLREFYRSTQDVRRYRPELRLVGVIPTFFDGRVRKSKEILDQLTNYFDGLVTPPVRYNVRISEAAAFGETIFEYDSRSNGAHDYQALALHLSRLEEVAHG